jgi:hypothetical protein
MVSLHVALVSRESVVAGSAVWGSRSEQSVSERSGVAEPVWRGDASLVSMEWFSLGVSASHARATLQHFSVYMIPL